MLNYNIYVSSSPSKIPYDGFSPVRLQTELLRRSSHHCLYAVIIVNSIRERVIHLTVGALPGKRHSQFHQRFVLSRGPWLPNGLCCPISSSLTTASSVTLSPSCGLIFFVHAGLRLEGQGREFPQFNPHIFIIMPSPTPRRPRRLHIIVPSPSIIAFAIYSQARQPQVHTYRFSCGQYNEAESSSLSLRPDDSLALHRQGRLLPSFHLPSRPKEALDMTMWVTINSHSRTFTGKMCSRMGCKNSYIKSKISNPNEIKDNAKSVKCLHQGCWKFGFRIFGDLQESGQLLLSP
ncbi:MAG: hypothetical protein DDT25_01233 [Chloroflexi bacterium]|nr:hypothetical protein [Chloroflexota bacterium]